MSHPSPGEPDRGRAPGVEPDPVLVSSRREAVIVFAVFVIAMFWSILVSYYLGYLREENGVKYIGMTGQVTEMTYVLGFPHWVFWGIVVPWSTCILFSIIFGVFIVRDEDLGQEVEEKNDDFL